MLLTSYSWRKLKIFVALVRLHDVDERSDQNLLSGLGRRRRDS